MNLKQLTREFVAIDQKMLDLQEHLCAANLTHRADQVDILRRAMTTVLYELSRKT